MQYLYHQDPGHGWLQVRREELERLGLLSRITSCSYQRGEWVFLEEDLDMGLFLEAKESLGEPVELVSRHVETTPIRSYPPFSAERD